MEIRCWNCGLQSNGFGNLFYTFLQYVHVLFTKTDLGWLSIFMSSNSVVQQWAIHHSKVYSEVLEKLTFIFASNHNRSTERKFFQFAFLKKIFIRHCQEFHRKKQFWAFICCAVKIRFLIMEGIYFHFNPKWKGVPKSFNRPQKATDMQNSVVDCLLVSVSASSFGPISSATISYTAHNAC